jgi:hypothetical protein
MPQASGAHRGARRGWLLGQLTHQRLQGLAWLTPSHDKPRNAWTCPRNRHLCEEFALHASVQLLQISCLCYQRSAAFPTKTMRSTSKSAETQIGHAFERGYTPARSRYQGSCASAFRAVCTRRMEGLKYCGGLNVFQMYSGVDRSADHRVTA